MQLEVQVEVVMRIVWGQKHLDVEATSQWCVNFGRKFGPDLALS